MSDSGGTILVVIPARGGSKGLPGKNLATVAGVSLVGRAVVRGREFVAREGLGARARVVVDTDDAAIAEEARRWGAIVPSLRPASLAADDTPTSRSLLHLLGRVDHDPDTVVLLQPTSPLARASEVSACWARFGAGDVASVVTTRHTGHPPALALREDAHGLLDWWAGEPPAEVRRQIHAPAFWPSGAVYVVDVGWFVEHEAFISAGRTAGVAVDDARSLDVDDPRDLADARLHALHSPADPDTGVDMNAVVPAGTTVRDTVERLIGRLERGDAVAGVRLGVGGGDALSRLGQITAVRSMFGLPVLWDSREGSREISLAARILGARLDPPVADMAPGRLTPEWLQTLKNR